MVYNEFGSLNVRTTEAFSALPVAESTVIIRGADELNRDVLYSLLTDEDGITVAVDLPAPNRSYSTYPNPAERPYSLYDVEIVKEGYYTKKIFDVVIFSGVKTNLPVNMIPIVSFEDGGSYPRGNINAVVTENENL